MIRTLQMFHLVPETLVIVTDEQFSDIPDSDLISITAKILLGLFSYFIESYFNLFVYWMNEVSLEAFKFSTISCMDCKVGECTPIKVIFAGISFKDV